MKYFYYTSIFFASFVCNGQDTPDVPSSQIQQVPKAPDTNSANTKQPAMGSNSQMPSSTGSFPLSLGGKKTSNTSIKF